MVLHSLRRTMNGRDYGLGLKCLTTVGLLAGLCATVISCAGERGQAGADGVSGPAGKDGTNGVDGAKGADGTNGVDGAKGADGTNGVDGAKGADGTNGADGEPGGAGPAGPAGPAGGAGPQGEPGEPDGRGPAYVLFDGDDKPVDAWLEQNPAPAYGAPYAPDCVPVQSIGQQPAGYLLLDLATGRPEACYDEEQKFGASSSPFQADSYFNSTDCSGQATAICFIVNPARINVNGVLYEAHGSLLGPWGQGTGGSNGTCVDVSASETATALCAFVPVPAAFVDAFDNPPYSVRIVY